MRVIRSIRIRSGAPYDVKISRGCLSGAGESLRALTDPDRVCVVTDSRVRPLWVPALSRSLEKAGIPCDVFSFPAGERSKTLSTFADAAAFFLKSGLTRKSAVLALGGGVTMDLTGFAAACYHRGIPWAALPTTFLSAVDASVGGKTGVDLPGSKNALGVFSQPALVLCDPGTFITLGEERWRDGAAESLKHGLIGDAALFETMLRPWRQRLEDVIAANILVKRAFVEADERDRGIRQLLNFGHTVGHAVEALSGYTMSHGRCVAIGMLAETRAAWRMGFGSVMPQTVKSALTACGLPTECPFDTDAVLSAALHDKKRAGSRITVAALSRLGEGFLQELTLDEFAAFLRAGLDP